MLSAPAVLAIVALPLAVVAQRPVVPPGIGGIVGNKTFCQIIAPELLTKKCGCIEKELGGTVNCTVKLPGIPDRVGLLADIAPCDEVAHVSLMVTEQKLNLNYTVAGVHAGQKVVEPIPGLAVMVPVVGNIGVDAVIEIDGDPDMLKIKLGIDACTKVAGFRTCGGDLVSMLPFYILSGRYHLSHLCEPALAARRGAQLLVV